jgi:DNA polymerase-3 subunit delta'
MIVGLDDFTANIFASFFAFNLICKNNNACLTCSSCVKALSDSNADLKVYPQNNKSIIVEDIENIIETSLVKPIENNNKVYLLKNFSESNIASQNKLLKILEEPPVNTYFILSVSNLDKILQTIKSRCKIVNVDNFTSEQVVNFLVENKVDTQKANNIAKYSQNNFGVALNLSKLTNYEDLINAVKCLFHNCNSTKDMLKTVSAIQPFSDNLNLFFSIVEVYLSKFQHYLVENTEIDEEFEQIKNNFSLLSLNAIQNLIVECRQKLQFNCSSSAVIDIFVLKFLEVKYKWK